MLDVVARIAILLGEEEESCGMLRDECKSGIHECLYAELEFSACVLQGNTKEDKQQQILRNLVLCITILLLILVKEKGQPI